MSKTDHTPAPWVVLIRPYDGTVMILPEKQEPGQLCICNVNDYGGMPAEANARLIAESPAMLELLTEAATPPGGLSLRDYDRWRAKVLSIIGRIGG